MAASMTPAQLVETFLKMYMAKFSTTRAELGSLYEDASSLTFEGTTIRGKAAIAGVIGKIPIPAGAAHRLVTTDLQPSPSAGAYVVMITGDISGSKFQQVFQLVPKAGGSYYIHNDIFRAGVAKPDNAPKEMAGDVVKSFVATYYQLFDSDRSKLAVVYKPASSFTFEKNTLVGAEAIVKHLSGLPATKHELATIDLQTVSGDATVLLAFVTGKVTIEGSTNPLNFCQTFQLVKVGATYYVHNDLFRLNYG